MLARRHRRTEEKRWSSCPRGAGSRGGSGIVLRAMFRILRCQGWKEFNMVLTHRIISEGERRTAVPYYLSSVCCCQLLDKATVREGEREVGGFTLNPSRVFGKEEEHFNNFPHLDAASGGLGTSTCEIHAEPLFISYFLVHSILLISFKHPRAFVHIQVHPFMCSLSSCFPFSRAIDYLTNVNRNTSSFAIPLFPNKSLDNLFSCTDFLDSIPNCSCPILVINHPKCGSPQQPKPLSVRSPRIPDPTFSLILMLFLFFFKCPSANLFETNVAHRSQNTFEAPASKQHNSTGRRIAPYRMRLRKREKRPRMRNRQGLVVGKEVISHVKHRHLPLSKG